MIRNDDYFEIIKEQNKELAKFRPFKSAYEMKKEIERLHSIIKEVRERISKLYENANKYGATHDKLIFYELLEILDKENKDGERY